MPAYNDVPQSELPSSRTLLRSTLIAAGVAALILFTIVMPAEYGVDPTGIGNVLGLTEMGRIKVSLEEEATAASAADTTSEVAPAVTPIADSSDAPAAGRTDTTSIALKPGQGHEIKLAMREGASVKYRWTVAGGVVNSDTHADRPGTPYHGYMKGKGQASDEGVLVAAFDGKHGWFWRNRGSAPVTVILTTTGEYTDLKEVK